MKIFCTILLAICLFSSPSFAESPRRGTSLKHYLTTSDFYPDRDFIVSSFSEPVENALAIFKTSQDLKVKVRILNVLVLFPKHKKTNAFLRHLLKNNQRANLLPSVIIAIGEVEGEASVSKISPFLKSEDDDVRMAAIIALGRYGGQEGGDLLAEYKELEHNPKHLVRIRVYLN